MAYDLFTDLADSGHFIFEEVWMSEVTLYAYIDLKRLFPQVN